jgi:hypothetical protein
MKIQQFVSTPKLIEITLDGAELLESYGEPITFYTYDIVSMSMYFDFFNARSAGEYDALGKLIRKMILDDKGNQVMAANQDLPIDIMASAVTKIGEILGKSLSKTSTQETGDAQV